MFLNNKNVALFFLIVAVNVSAMSFLNHLAQEVDPNRAQKFVRMQLRGNEQRCTALFKEAMRTNNVIAQIYLSNAYMAMQRSKDSTKDFVYEREETMESYKFSYDGHDHLIDVLIAARGYKPKDGEDWELLKTKSEQLIDEAAQSGNSYARLVKIEHDRCTRSFSGHFGTACKLKQLIDKSPFPEFLYRFGASLFNSGLYYSQHELEGLKYMEKSGFLNLKFFEDEKKDRYSDFKDYCSADNGAFYDRYGMRFVGEGTILVPSREHWVKFINEKLNTVLPTPEESFDLFNRHDMKLINNLSKKYNLVFVIGEINGLPCLHISSNGESLGQLCITSVESKTTNEIVLSCQYEELTPVIAFLKDALISSGDSSSVEFIMQDLRHYS